MPVIVATAKATNANSYATVAEASAHLRTRRLYTEAWDDADAKSPSADGYLCDGITAAGESTVTVKSGTGDLRVNDQVQFAGHSTEYTVTTALASGGTSLVISPVLTSGVADDEAVTRLTANDRERSLIMATAVLDESMDWEGAKTTTTQALRQPRTGLVDLDGDTIDDDTIWAGLRAGTIEFAAHLLARDRTQEPGVLGAAATSAASGGMSAQYKRRDLIPEFVLNILRPTGFLSSIGSSARFANVRRA